MRVSRRRYSRRHCSSGFINSCSTRTKGHFSVRESAPVYEPVPCETVEVSIPSVLPRYRAGPLDTVRIPVVRQLVTVAWMNPVPGFILRNGYVCASKGFEKTCVRQTRRKRGLRKNKSRSRGCQPRRTSFQPATVSKTPSDRTVNHSGRKFIWAVKTSNTFRKQCERLNKFPRGQLHDLHPARAPRLKMKRFLLAKWTRLHNRAEAMGIPPVAAFHASFWKYLLVETSRGGDKKEAWDSLLFGLPGNPASDWTEGISSTTIVESPRIKRRTRGAVGVRPVQKKIICRSCGYVGFGPHETGALCKTPVGKSTEKSGRPSRRR